MQFETTSKICLVILCLLCVSTIGLPQSDGATFFMKDEIWKDINGYEGKYQISNLGRVKALARFDYGAKNKSLRQYKERILKPGLTDNGYNLVVLIKDTIKTSYHVHRLVGITFIDNPENKKCINHKDGIKTNCAVSNLEWCTHSENNTHAYKNGLKKSHPETIHTARLTWDDVNKIREIKSPNLKLLAMQYKVTISHLRNIINHACWKTNSQNKN